MPELREGTSNGGGECRAQETRGLTDIPEIQDRARTRGSQESPGGGRRGEQAAGRANGRND